MPGQGDGWRMIEGVIQSDSLESAKIKSNTDNYNEHA